MFGEQTLARFRTGLTDTGTAAVRGIQQRQPVGPPDKSLQYNSGSQSARQTSRCNTTAKFVMYGGKVLRIIIFKSAYFFLPVFLFVAVSVKHKTVTGLLCVCARACVRAQDL